MSSSPVSRKSSSASLDSRPLKKHKKPVPKPTEEEEDSAVPVLEATAEESQTEEKKSSFFPDQDDAALVAEVEQQEQTTGYIVPIEDATLTPEQIEAKARADFEAKLRDDPALKAINKMLAPLWDRFNITNPSLEDASGNSRLKVKVFQSKKSKQWYINVGYNGLQLRLPGINKFDIHNSLMICTPPARISLDKMKNALLPNGNFGTEFVNELKTKYAEMIWTLTDEPMIDNPMYRNKAWIEFHHMVYDKMLPEIMSKLEVEFERIWPLDWQKAKAANQQIVTKLQQDKKKSDKSLANVAVDKIQLTEEEKEAAGWVNETALGARFIEVQREKIIVRLPFEEDGSRCIMFKHRMVGVASPAETEAMLDPNWKSVSGSTLLTQRMREMAEQAMKDNAPDSKIDPDNRTKAKADRPLLTFRLLTPEEHERDPNKESFIRMTPQEMLDIQAGDWVQTVATWSWSQFQDTLYLNLVPCAMIWIGHHEDLVRNTKSFIDPADMEEEKKIPIITISCAQVPRLIQLVQPVPDNLLTLHKPATNVNELD